MSEPVGRWRARAYWCLPTALLPLLNPLAFALLAADSQGPPWVPVAIGIAAVNGLLLLLVASWIWKRVEAIRWRVAVGFAVSLVLSLAYGFGELLLFLELSCPNGGCFD
jgi:hypothetical protein